MKYIPISGNSDYTIAIDGVIKYKDSVPAELNEESTVTLKVFGEIRTFDRVFLAVCSAYGLTSLEELDKATIGKIENGLTTDPTGYWIRFKEPVWHSEGFRVIADRVHYAVSEDGIVIDRRTGKVKNPEMPGERYPGHYPSVKLDSPTKGDLTSTKVHRCVALAWCDNDDPTSKYVVDHLDMNRLNYHRNNLEWVTNAENLRRALHTSSQAIPVLLRNRHSGVVTEFPSMSQCAEFLGITPGNVIAIFKKKRPGWVDENFEIKLSTDDTDWRYPLDVRKNSRYEVTVVPKGGEPFVLYGIKEVYKYVNKFYQQPFKANVPILVDMLSKVPSIEKVSYIDYHSPTCQGWNVKTGEIVEASGFAEMEKLTGVDNRSIRRFSVRYAEDDPVVIFDWVFRHKSDRPWATKYRELMDRSQPIEVLNLKTGEKTTHSSIRAAAVELGAYRATLMTSLQSGGPAAGYVVKKL